MDKMLAEYAVDKSKCQISEERIAVLAPLLRTSDERLRILQEATVKAKKLTEKKKFDANTYSDQAKAREEAAIDMAISTFQRDKNINLVESLKVLQSQLQSGSSAIEMIESKHKDLLLESGHVEEGCKTLETQQLDLSAGIRNEISNCSVLVKRSKRKYECIDILKDQSPWFAQHLRLYTPETPKEHLLDLLLQRLNLQFIRSRTLLEIGVDSIGIRRLSGYINIGSQLNGTCEQIAACIVDNHPQLSNMQLGTVFKWKRNKVLKSY